MNNNRPDQSVQMLGLTWPFDVCIAKGRFSCLVVLSIDDLTKVKGDYAYAKSKEALHKLISPFIFHCSYSIIFLNSNSEISYLLTSFITYLPVYISNLSVSSISALEYPLLSPSIIFNLPAVFAPSFSNSPEIE